MKPSNERGCDDCAKPNEQGSEALQTTCDAWCEALLMPDLEGHVEKLPHSALILLIEERYQTVDEAKRKGGVWFRKDPTQVSKKEWLRSAFFPADDELESLRGDAPPFWQDCLGKLDRLLEWLKSQQPKKLTGRDAKSKQYIDALSHAVDAKAEMEVAIWAYEAAADKRSPDNPIAAGLYTLSPSGVGRLLREFLDAGRAYERAFAKPFGRYTSGGLAQSINATEQHRKRLGTPEDRAELDAALQREVDEELNRNGHRLTKAAILEEVGERHGISGGGVRKRLDRAK